MNQNAKYCTPKLITTSNVTDKERTRVFLLMIVSTSCCFHAFKGLKTVSESRSQSFLASCYVKARDNFFIPRSRK